MTSSSPSLASVAYEQYGVGLCVFSPVPVLWAADRLADVVGVEQAKRELRKANRLREKHALIPAVFEYGHRLF